MNYLLLLISIPFIVDFFIHNEVINRFKPSLINPEYCHVNKSKFFIWKLFNCAECLSFWLTLIITIVIYHNILIAILFAIILSRLAMYLDKNLHPFN